MRGWEASIQTGVSGKASLKEATEQEPPALPEVRELSLEEDVHYDVWLCLNAKWGAMGRGRGGGLSLSILLP